MLSQGSGLYGSVHVPAGLAFCRTQGIGVGTKEFDILDPTLLVS